ncbi:MAG: exo-alpha-sialidase [Planctomycetaceae bacterium]|nr:exo-alpha-sialidase [Planctomycetaceae bacterium]
MLSSTRCLLPYLIGISLTIATLPSISFAAEPVAEQPPVTLDPLVRGRCLNILREGLRSDQFWHSIHAAEGLTAGGHGAELRPFLIEKLAAEIDDQRRCGLARELVRSGDRRFADVLFSILGSHETHGHVHAAESLFKVREVGDGAALRQAFARDGNPGLKVMSGAALARGGSPLALLTLRDLLQSDDSLTAKLAAWALARVGDSSDIPALQRRAAKEDDPASRTFYDYALALLGDANGRTAAIANFHHDDDTARTMAAEFAPEIPHAGELVPALIAMLDDPWPDARIRAAHALFAIAHPAAIDRGDDISNFVFEATDEHPRCSEGSVLDLYDGSLLCAMTVFDANTSDFAKARIIGRRSTDGGRTWGEPQVLQENSGDMNVIGATLRRLKSPAAAGTIGLFYAQTNTFSDLRFYVRFSNDEGATFGEPILVTGNPGYHVVNNDRVTQLSTGRLVVPAASTADVEKEDHFVCHCYVSDDGGRTWRDTPGRVDAPKRGAMEPEVVELSDGRLLMIVRTQTGHIATSHSDDGGETWSEPGHFEGVPAPESPATIRRIPATGDLLLIWNNTFDANAGHGGARTPLSTAISTDDGRTWRNFKPLESDPEHTYAYTSVLFLRNRMLFTYYDCVGDRYSAHFRSLPVSWLYEE